MKLCLRCKYKLPDIVYNYSTSKLGYSLCRNCQDWFTSSNGETIEEKKELLNKIRSDPEYKYCVPEYDSLLEQFNSCVDKDNQIVYQLKHDNGNIKEIKSNIDTYRCGGFRHKKNTYQVIAKEKNFNLCRQIPDDLFAPVTSNKNDITLLNFEESIINFFSEREIKVLPNTLDEKLFRQLILNELSKHFTIEEEVSGTHFSGRKMKIDAILRPRDNSEWRNKELVFGLEIKNPLTWETNNRRDTDILAQCLDYSFTKFKGVKDIVIVMCPLLPGLKKHDKLIRFISRYNVGHLDLVENKICMGLGGQEFWNDQKTTTWLKKSLFKKKYGNRGYKK